MSYPTADQLDAIARTLTTAPWAKHVARLNHAIERERRGGSNLPDGYPTTTLPGSSGGSELTSVEAAVHARSLPRRDEHHDRTRLAVDYLQQAAMSYAAFVCQLDRLEARVAHIDGADPGCSHHARYGTFEERFRGDLCRACYLFKKDYGQLTPTKLLDDRARGIRWTTATINAALRATS